MNARKQPKVRTVRELSRDLLLAVFNPRVASIVPVVLEPVAVAVYAIGLRHTDDTASRSEGLR